MKQKVTGIGGFFFRAHDPKALAAWYEDHLGVSNLHEAVWQQAAGATIFGPFAMTTEYFGRPDRQWLINFRVDDLDAMMAQLKSAGIEIETRREWDSEVVVSHAFTIQRGIQSSYGNRFCQKLIFKQGLEPRSNSIGTDRALGYRRLGILRPRLARAYHCYG